MSDSIIVEPTESPNEEQEAQEASTATKVTAAEVVAEPELPSKYKGKTFEEVMQMHQNLEKEYGRQANEVGTYRELVSSLADVKRVKDLSEEGTTDKKPPVEVTSDSLFDNPTQAIEAVVRSVLEKELAPVKESQATSAHERALQQLSAEYPDAETIGADPRFVAYVEASPYRLADAQRWVEQRDVDSARRLLSDYKAAVPEAPAAEQAPTKTPKTVVTEAGRGGAGTSSGKKIIYRDQVLRLIAKDPEKYRSASFQDELKQAIAEGRFKG
jgi:hypothetical protein